MGRLRKSVVDTIVRLRKQGFTQAEVAEKTKVHLKSVQKYDPLRNSNNQVRPGTSSGKPTYDPNLFTKYMANWVESIALTLQFEAKVELVCPSCLDGKLHLDDYTGMTYNCKRCEYKLPLLTYILEGKYKPD